MENVSINPTIRLDDKDNVIVARKDIPAGTVILEEGIIVHSDVLAGYKIAAKNIRKGEPILKYNTIIGFSSDYFESGTMLHSHNIGFKEIQKDYAYCRDYKPLELVSENERATFQGIVR